MPETFATMALDHHRSAETAADAPFTPPLPKDARVNPIRDGAAWAAQRSACRADPGAFHGAIAAQVLHWWHPEANAWMTRAEDGAWTGWHAETGAPVVLESPDWTPWATAFDDRDAPFYRWFSGGLTNAAFNEVDRHVLAGHGAEPAFLYEGDRWDPSANGGKGGPVHQRSLTRRALLIESVLAARALQDLGLRQGDRIAFNMPNILEQIIWTEGAKRLGILYTPVFGGFSDKTLSDRIENAGARVVITADGASRNAELVPYKESYTDPALDRFIALPDALATVARVADADVARALSDAVTEALAGEITVDPADVMRAVGRVLDRPGGPDPARAATVRVDLAEALAAVGRQVERVVVVRHTQVPDMAWTEGRDVWAHDLIAAAETALLSAAGVADRAALEALPDDQLVPALWRLVSPRPVDAEFPLFIMYTSGSTGKPKGVVHTHGGYVAGVAHTMAVSFDALPGRDVLYVVADPGWITGQSYLITAALATRIPSVVTEGAPVFPHAGRFASIIERHGVTLFKAGSTFLKAIMTHPQDRADVARHDTSSVRVATFCAEPTSPAVQRFAMGLVAPWYINSYWATEHGGIVWTHPYANPDQPLRADAHTWPLPWVMGDVWVADGEPDADGRRPWRRAADGERGEIVITAPYPYLARTLWGDGEDVGRPGWTGDLERFSRTYFGRFRNADGTPALAYVQGDVARRHGDGAFSLHGRSDDVINVAGHRMGTEEIEGAILKDKQMNPDSPVGNCIVIGAPHADKGLTPVAFVVPARGRRLTPDDARRLRDLVRQEKGAVAVPSDFILVEAFPETRSGKYMRRFLKALMRDEALGDTSTLRNPEILTDIGAAIAAWKHGQGRAESQTLLETTRFLRVQYDRVLGADGREAHGAAGRKVATVIIVNPPVNALSERVLDELDTLVGHLARRDDVGAVVIAGQGGRTFVAGADIRQFLDQVADADEARALPAKAHAVFDRLERMDTPVIAAVEGLALGGGLELAMACHVRIGAPDTQVGHPEITLFMPPGYGGTQRLPRLLLETVQGGYVGLVEALVMLLSGRRVDGRRAHALGLLDRLAEGADDPLTLAQALAREAVLYEDCWANDAMKDRHAALARWDEPGAFPNGVLEDAAVTRCLRQAQGMGRGPVASTIVDLVRHGLEKGYRAGLAAEIAAFARLLPDADNGGRKGIQLFLDKHSPPLPARPRPAFDADARRLMVAEGRLLPVGAPFFPGVTHLPHWQAVWAVVRDQQTGAARHADPEIAEVEAPVLVPEPGPNQALLYVLVSEINFNDIWAITGIPVSLFDEHDEDVHVTGSGGVGMVVRLGEAVRAEGRVRIGDLVALQAGVSDLLDPLAGRDPMATAFHIQGYQSPDGSHQQFMLADGPQMMPLPPGLSLEAAGSYLLTAGTAYRALFTALAPRPGAGLLVEGAATGTGAFAVQLGRAARLSVVGLVSSPARMETVRALGGAPVDRTDPAWVDAFRRVPANPDQWPAWEAAGRPFVDAVTAANGGRPVDHALSHAGERSFPRAFQALGEGGSITFFGASSGYHMTFLGKPGTADPAAMLARAGVRPGQGVVVFLGADNGARDDTALGALEAARALGARIVAVTDTDAQRDFVLSLGFGDAVVGAVSLAALKRRHPDFVWPDTMPDLPDPQRQTAAFKEAVRRMTALSFKPLGAAIGALLRGADTPRGQPDLVVERAHRDSLVFATMLVKPNTGRVVYCGDMGGRRYSFYAPQVWMRQRRILMPTAAILGSHLHTAAEALDLTRMVAAGTVQVSEPALVDWADLPAAHQAMWENRLPEWTGGRPVAVVNHALPEPGLTSRDDLLAAWAARMGEEANKDG